MAASMQKCACRSFFFIYRRIFLQTRPECQVFFNSRMSRSTDVSQEGQQTFEIDEEDEIEKIRDVSNLSDRLRKRLRNDVPEAWNDYMLTKRYSRRLYAKFGSSSGINPGIQWPSKKELQERIEDEREWEQTFGDMTANIEARNKRKIEIEEFRAQRIQKNMEKMSGWVKEYRMRQLKTDKEAEDRAAKKQQILEEAREYFGYYVDPRDEKFKEMLAEKEKQEKKLTKERKKEDKLNRMIARLQQQADETQGSEGKS